MRFLLAGPMVGCDHLWQQKLLGDVMDVMNDHEHGRSGGWFETSNLYLVVELPEEVVMFPQVHATLTASLYNCHRTVLRSPYWFQIYEESVL